MLMAQGAAQVLPSSLPTALILAGAKRRAAVCWVRQVEQQCRAALPRRCSVFLATDSEEVRRVRCAHAFASFVLDVGASPSSEQRATAHVPSRFDWTKHDAACHAHNIMSSQRGHSPGRPSLTGLSQARTQSRAGCTPSEACSFVIHACGVQPCKDCHFNSTTLSFGAQAVMALGPCLAAALRCPCRRATTSARTARCARACVSASPLTGLVFISSANPNALRFSDGHDAPHSFQSRASHRLQT
jgi:hypothetical protein